VATTSEDNLNMVEKPILKLSDQIRVAVESSGVSAYRISADTGIDKAALSRFLSGERGLSLDSLDLLAGYFGMSIVLPSKSKRVKAVRTNQA
jgi:transcriptional regulator with XRE-family HTH domain